MRFLVVIGLVIGVGEARADDAAAKALFDQGKTLFAEGKYGEACQKLEASYTLNKLSGTGGLLGACFEKIGRFASAWSAYRDSAVIADRQGNAERAAAARQSAAELTGKLAWLTVDAKAALAIRGVRITIDGHVPPVGLFGAPFPVDAGPHLIEAAALDYKPWKQTIDIADGEKQQVALPRLVEDPTRRLVLERRAADERRIAHRRKVMFYGFVGGGAGALAVATTLGILAHGQWGRARDLGCDDRGTCPTAGGATEVDGAATKADVATYVGAAGLLLVGAGIVVRLTSPTRAQKELRLMPSGTGVALGGTF
ncbi:MAG: hypothetical protein ABI867_27510 [Kofleriaceae bacterium]